MEKVELWNCEKSEDGFGIRVNTQGVYNMSHFDKQNTFIAVDMPLTKRRVSEIDKALDVIINYNIDMHRTDYKKRDKALSKIMKMPLRALDKEKMHQFYDSLRIIADPAERKAEAFGRIAEMMGYKSSTTRFIDDGRIYASCYAGKMYYTNPRDIQGYRNHEVFNYYISPAERCGVRCDSKTIIEVDTCINLDKDGPNGNNFNVLDMHASVAPLKNQNFLVLKWENDLPATGKVMDKQQLKSWLKENNRDYNEYFNDRQNEKMPVANMTHSRSNRFIEDRER